MQTTQALEKQRHKRNTKKISYFQLKHGIDNTEILIQYWAFFFTKFKPYPTFMLMLMCLYEFSAFIVGHIRSIFDWVDQYFRSLI